MPYWTPSLAEEEGPGAVGEGGDKSPIQWKEDRPAAPSMAPEEQGEESKGLLFVTPLGGDKPSGPSGDEPAPAEEVVDPSEEKGLPKLPEGDESNAT